jgi:hypothetical protein
VALLQRSAEKESSRHRALKVSQLLMADEGLGPAAMLLCKLIPHSNQIDNDADNNDGAYSFINDFLPCNNGVKHHNVFRTSVMAHLLVVLGALRVLSKQRISAPNVFAPFALFFDLTPSLLQTTYWPGAPDNQWHAWKYSGEHKAKCGGNIGIYRCSCSYIYCMSECLGPANSFRCANPDKQCMQMNGGGGHLLGPNQTFLGWVVKRTYVWANFDRPCDGLTSIRPGLFATTEAELASTLRRTNCDVATEAKTFTTVRQLSPTTFRVLHLLVHLIYLSYYLLVISLINYINC